MRSFLIVIGLSAVAALAWPYHDHRAHHAAPARALTGPSASCHYRDGGALPDPACTPGAINHAVTQHTIRSTICKPGWTSSIRPDKSVTEPQKFASMRAYHDSTANGQAALYEYDHLVPLELGGSPTDTRNLWPEMHHVGTPDAGSVVKDRVENALNARVCSGRLSLRAARRIMRTDWRTTVP